MRFLTTPEAAQKLKVCESTIRNLVRQGKLPSFRDYNGRLKFRPNDVGKLKAERERILAAEGR